MYCHKNILAIMLIILESNQFYYFINCILI